VALKRTGFVVWQNKWKQCYRECSKWPPCAWTHAPSRFRHWSIASSTTLCCSPAHVSTSRCWKMTFLIFPRYSSYSMWVRWADLQPSNVKFLQDSVCQKWLKSVHFWWSYLKNKNVSVFLGTQCRIWFPTPSTSLHSYQLRSFLHIWVPLRNYLPVSHFVHIYSELCPILPNSYISHVSNWGYKNPINRSVHVKIQFWLSDVIFLL